MNPSYSISHRTRLGCSTKRLSRRGVFEFKSRLFRFVACALALAFAWCAAPVGAEDFTQGELEGSLDITLSHGVTLRVGDRDDRLIGRAEGAGTANSVNSDDGNLNYDSGIVSNASKFIGELDLNYRNFGAFARVHGFSTSRTIGAKGRAANSRPKRRIWSEKTLKCSIYTSPARLTWAARRWT